MKRRMSPLTRKLMRDLKDGWKSFVAIWIICMLAITLYMGIDATWRGMEKNLDAQFAEGNLADIWVRGAVTDRTVRDIEAIDGVQTAQRRVAVEVKADELEGEPTVALFMSDGESMVNRPIMSAGEGFTPLTKNQCILNDRFANAHGLDVGDTLRLKVDGRLVDLVICGLGMLSEYVVTNDGTELAPSPAAFGYACVSEGTLSFLPYSQVTLTIEPGADVTSVKRAIQDLVDDNQTAVSVREEIPGVKMAMEEAQQIRAMGAIFPVVFFVIAALITWTTMSRLVENQRIQIGSLLALGYGRAQLTWHYASYGLLLAGLGALSGFAGARYGIAEILLVFLTPTYAMPGVAPYMAPLMLILISLLLMAITGGAAMLSARSALRQSPAALLRPKPPGKGKRVFLENIGGIWKRLRFSEKMIMRNMLRNPVRLLMGMIGAAGCAALMLTGFGLRDSVEYVMANHFTQTMHYDARVKLSDGAPLNYGCSVALRAGADSFEEEMITACEVYADENWKMKQVYVLEDGHDMIQLSDESGARVTLPPEGIALTRKAAEDLGLTLGDALDLRIPGGRAVKAEIARIIELQLDQGIYVSRSAWAKLDLRAWTPTAVLLRGDALNLAFIKDMESVYKVHTLQEEREDNTTLLEIMNVIVLLIVLFSGVLAFVVFYNLGQLNFSERIRELATLKVLGFTPREIKKLVLRENVIITFMGLPFGMLFGPILHRTVLTYGLPNTIQFVPYIQQMSWAFTVLFTIAFALLVNWLLGTKFKEVNMVEALKSVE